MGRNPISAELLLRGVLANAKSRHRRNSVYTSPRGSLQHAVLPRRDKDQFPWFWDGDTFTGERVNDRHYTNAQKQAARASIASVQETIRRWRSRVGAKPPR